MTTIAASSSNEKKSWAETAFNLMTKVFPFICVDFKHIVILDSFDLRRKFGFVKCSSDLDMRGSYLCLLQKLDYYIPDCNGTRNFKSLI